jgi:hypothetical protein
VESLQAATNSEGTQTQPNPYRPLRRKTRNRFGKNSGRLAFFFSFSFFPGGFFLLLFFLALVLEGYKAQRHKVEWQSENERSKTG